MRRHALVIAVLVAGCGDDPPATSGLAPGEIIGRIEISEDVPASSCRVLLDGSPLGSACDGVGGFDIRGVVPGRWDLRVIADLSTGLPARVLPVAANPGFVTDLGAIRLAQAGSIGGRVVGADEGIVVLPSYGIVTAPNANGGYLLIDVPPGVHDVVLITDDGTVVRTDVTVLPAKTTIQVDLDASSAVDVVTQIDGYAFRAGLADGGHGDLTVELLDAVTGDVEAETSTEADGAFVLSAGSGIYVLRARDGDSPITAIIPSVVPRGDLPLHLVTALVVYPEGGDLDADGADDADDPDIDNDGVANAADAFPYDPAEAQDVDGDGLGDRADLATQGSGVDTQNDTPDADGDGRFDFEDVCALVADPLQGDVDGDGAGDACDNCPVEPNADQQDSVGDGIGDVCRACAGSEDCPLGATCQQGECVACTVDSQCGGEVCRDGACVPCSAAEACGGDLVCNEPTGFCQDCLVNLDCDAGSACVAGHCFAGCEMDDDCGVAAYCVSAACVECRGNIDCPGTEWCDAGLCQPQCSVDANCSGGRICDQGTRTCVLPCSAGCPTGQTCDLAGVCRETCDGSFPCTGGLTCNLATNECEPECDDDGDCSGAFDECQLGECVPNGDCGLDTDCPSSEMCGQFGSCVARPTGFDPTAGAYTCTGACDCKLGETCDPTGHCAPDPVPTRFVSAGATGNGLSITAPSGDFRAMITSLPAGANVAVRGGQTFASDGGPVVLTAANISVQGGYVVCSTTRWVRDATQTSTITNANPGFGFINLTGTFAFPAADVVIGGLTLQHPPSSSGTRVLVDAIYAPRLHVHDLVVVQPAPSGNVTMVQVINSPDVLVEDIHATSLVSNAGNTFFDMVRLGVSDGVVRDVTIGVAVDTWTVDAVVVSDVTGPTTIERVTTGPMTLYGSSDVVRVESTPAFPVTVREIHTGALASMGGGTGDVSGVHVVASGNVAVSEVSFGSPGFIDPVLSGVLNRVIGVWFDNSSGTIDDCDIAFEPITSADFAVGYRVTGPAGAVTLTNCATSGAGGPQTRLIEAANITAGTVVVAGGSFALTDSGAIDSIGLSVDDAPVVVTDATFQLPGTADREYGAFITGTASTRIERTRLLPGATAGVTDYTVGARVNGGATLELYDSWLRGGPTASVASVGLWLDGSFTIRAIGNTIDGGGASNQNGTSAGVRCQEGSTPGTAMFSSNLVDGGRAIAHYMVHDYDDNDGYCASPSAWDHNYLAFRASGAQIDSFQEDADLIGVVNMNVVGNNVTCFDGAFSNDFRIALGSPCVNAGVAGTRLDASPIMLDLLGGVRILGAAADIGAQERQ